MNTLVVPTIEQGVNGLVVPEFDNADIWPSLGGQVCDFIEDCLVHGPGGIRGDRAQIDAETRLVIYRLYEVYPQGHVRAGRRRFQRGVISKRKGTSKTEEAAWLAACELHPEGPVRCDGFDANGQPVGIGVRDPFIPMVAYTEEQTEELAYKALYVAISEGPLANDFDIGLRRITRKDGTGKAISLSSSPNALDGARTSFSHCDETHRFILKRLKDAHQTMSENLSKRYDADPWGLETTTAPVPGEGSIAETVWEYAEALASKRKTDGSLFFFHRQASDKHDLSTDQGIEDAVTEASGTAISYTNFYPIVNSFKDPTKDKAYLIRVWLNRKTQSSSQIFNLHLIKNQTGQIEGNSIPLDWQPKPKDEISIGFDGSRVRDATGIIGTHIATGIQFPIGIWQRPEVDFDDWEVPVNEVDTAFREAMKTWKVRRAYCDPFYWDIMINEWAGKWPKKVIIYRTNQEKKMAYAVKSYVNAWKMKEVFHNGNTTFLAHLGNARKQELNIRDDTGEKLYLMTKERRNSPNKIDLAMAGCLSWEARAEAISKGALNRQARTITFA